MDESQQESTKSELSDSWLVISETSADQVKENGLPSDGSDGESVEVIDHEEYDEVLTREIDYDASQTDEETNGPKNKKYVHHPNEDVNAALNRLMVIAASIVVGLAVGHYLGYSEEVNDMATAMKKLQDENFKLKNHICMTLENYDNHITHITSSAYSELKHFNEHYAVFITFLLNLTCPHTDTKLVGLQTSLDDLRQALLDNHIPDDELHSRIDEILENHSNHLADANYMNVADEVHQNERETVVTQDKGQSTTKSQTTETVTFREHFSETHADTDTLTVKMQEGDTSKTEIADLTRSSILESAPARVQVQAEATKSVLPDELINSLNKSPSKFSEECQTASDSKDSPVDTEVPNKSTLKHIVKDVVQEITESIFASHHNDIIRDIRNEVKKLMQSVPVFKPALLLNKEMTSKLKSHLKYTKDMLYSVLENSPGMTDKGNIDDIFSSLNLYALHLEKAIDSLQLSEVPSTQKRTSMLNVKSSNVCTVSDFLQEVFINNHGNTHIMECSRKNSNDPHKVNHMYIANQFQSGKHLIDDATSENLLQKKTIENDGKISNLANYQKIENGENFIAKQPVHGSSSKHDKRQKHEIKDKKKKKQDHDNKKYKKSKQHSAETERYKEKDERTYNNFKTMKEKHHDHDKKLRNQYHYKEEKQFKRELRDTRKKNSHDKYKWDKDGGYEHSNVSGDWVIDMNRARAESRENEHKSDWLFERAYARKAKRNGKWDINNWYFQRAEGRKSCRQKSLKEKIKIPYPPPNDSEKEYHDNNNKQHQKQRKWFKPKRWISKAYMSVSKFRF